MSGNVGTIFHFLNNDDRNYVEPDLSVICNPSILDEKGCHGAPDWIIEIVSPSSERMDYVVKTFKYRTAGVREYWVIDKTLQKVTVLILKMTICLNMILHRKFPF